MSSFLLSSLLPLNTHFTTSKTWMPCHGCEQSDIVKVYTAVTTVACFLQFVSCRSCPVVLKNCGATQNFWLSWVLLSPDLQGYCCVEPNVMNQDLEAAKLYLSALWSILKRNPQSIWPFVCSMPLVWCQNNPLGLLWLHVKGHCPKVCKTASENNQVSTRLWCSSQLCLFLFSFQVTVLMCSYEVQLHTTSSEKILFWMTATDFKPYSDEFLTLSAVCNQMR